MGVTETPIQQNLVAKNKEYASSFTQGHLALPPAKKYAILTCMDARIDPSSAYGIDLGDAHVIRNAGGSARDALRSLIISQQLLGTQEVLVIKHTGCGMLTFSNEDAKGIVKKNLGDAGFEELGAFKEEFLPFTNLEEEAKKDVQWIRDNKAIPESVAVSGWIYEVESGKVKRVV